MLYVLLVTMRCWLPCVLPKQGALSWVFVTKRAMRMTRASTSPCISANLKRAGIFISKTLAPPRFDRQMWSQASPPSTTPIALSNMTPFSRSRLFVSSAIAAMAMATCNAVVA